MKNILFLKRLFSYSMVFSLFFILFTYSSFSYSTPKANSEKIRINAKNFSITAFTNEKGEFEKTQKTKSVTRSLSGTLEKMASSSLNPEYILHLEYLEQNDETKSVQNINTTLRLKKNEILLLGTIKVSEFYLIQGVKKEKIKKNRLHIQIN